MIIEAVLYLRKNKHMSRLHHELHRMHRINWLRAAVLGANDGIISTASLMLGVAASDASHHAILIAGLAGLIAGAMSARYAPIDVRRRRHPGTRPATSRDGSGACAVSRADVHSRSAG